jgi:hypothetical protein
VDFTDRWLSYYKRNFSYVKVIIADGSNEMLFTKSQEQNLSKNLQYLHTPYFLKDGVGQEGGWGAKQRRHGGFHSFIRLVFAF